MAGLSRRQFLLRAAALAAITGLDLEVLAPTLAARASASTDIPTTLQQTILHGQALRGGYRTLATGPGEAYIARTDILRRAAPAGRASSRRSLLYLGHLSDMHVIDAQSPARIEPMIVQDHSAWGSAFHPHDPMSPHTTTAMIQAFSDARYSPLTGAPMGAAVVTGDSADMHSHLELRWYIDLMDGRAVNPATAGATFQGVQAWAEATWAYRPGDPAGGDFAVHGFPTLPRLLEQVVAREVESPGIPAPWYAVYGNHDTLLLGTFGLTPQMHALAVGGQKSYAMEATATSMLTGYAASTSPLQQWLDQWSVALGRPGFKAVPENGERRLFAQRDFMAEHFVTEPTPGPVGHGFTQQNLDSGQTWWTADFSPQV
ncbi:MAG: TIGR03767 family metallophosphoesterase, partial [Actinobacteria bacterium]|nr:TIGR03767 family metallophosphoesterase [Actinomycetota bacterium]